MGSSSTDVRHIRPLRRAEYDLLVERGCFVDERVELIEGGLVAMSPASERHDFVVAKLSNLLARQLDDTYDVRTQSGFAASDISQPEPDVAVVEAARSDGQRPRQAYLIVEVALSSLAFDRQAKGRLYAAAGVPEYWVVDVEARRVEVYTEPSDDGYRGRRVASDGMLTPLCLPGVVLELAKIFPSESTR